MSVAVPELGETLAGRYELLASLGEGGMSVVYRARDAKTGAEVAFKLLTPRYLGRPEREQRLLDEARYLERLRGQPGIVALIDHGRLRDRHRWPYLVTELLAGRPLNWLLIKHKFEAGELRELAGGIARALATCHAAGVVHRDLTPTNVFVTRDPIAVKLFDFSHAASLDTAGALPGTGARLTGVFDVPGTSGYMGPEQASSAPADPKMDVFSFGVLVYEIITGRNPYPNVSHGKFIELQRAGSLEPPRLQAWAHGVGEDWAELVRDCTLEDPARRPTIAEVVERIDRSSLDHTVPMAADEVARLQAATRADASDEQPMPTPEMLGAWGPPPQPSPIVPQPDEATEQFEGRTAVFERPAEVEATEQFEGRTSVFERRAEPEPEPAIPEAAEVTTESELESEPAPATEPEPEPEPEPAVEPIEGPTAIRPRLPSEEQTEPVDGPTEVGRSPVAAPVLAQPEQPAPAFARPDAKPIVLSPISEPEPERDEVAPPSSPTGLRRWWPALALVVLAGVAVAAWLVGNSGARRQPRAAAPGEFVDGEQPSPLESAPPQLDLPEISPEVAETGVEEPGPDPEVAETGGELDTTESESGSEPESEGSDDSTADPKPRPRDKPQLGAKPDCDGVEEAGLAAHEQRDWKAVIKHTSNKRCWSSNRERLRLRVEALAQTKRWSECLEAAEAQDDPKLDRWVKFCSKNI